MTIKVTYNITDVYMSQSVSPVYINVSYSDGGASGGGVWGSITGTLSNQTDLQNALNAKLDESTIDGGTEGQILSKASATDFDFAWINNYAKYLATNVRNQSGSTIGAFQVVYISGATGNKPLISLADADTEATSSKTYGVTATAIANNGTGDVVTAGELSGINTSAFNEGDLLWLSTTAGGVVTTPPAEPAHAVFIGYVVRSHPTLGVIDVAIANGYELNELHGVQVTTPTDNQGLFYNATSTLWENKSITTALGYTPVPTTRNITINGVTYDLSADRTWTISTGISGSGAAGQVTYWTGASAVSGSNNLFWDNTNGRLGIGTNAPEQRLHVLATAISTAIFSHSGTDGGIDVRRTSALETGRTSQIRLSNGTTFFGASDRSYQIINIARSATTTDLQFQYWDGTSYLDRFRLFSSGNFGINTGTTDSGQRLQVIGDTLLRGSGATSATTALTVQNSGTTNMWRFLNDGELLLGSNASGAVIYPSGANGILNIGGLNTTFYTSVTTQNFGIGAFNFTGTTLAPTSGFNTQVSIDRQFAPTSGTAQMFYLTIAPTINQTGGANGITRGLYVNPTLTAAADWRSIEWSNNTGWGLYGAGTANNYLAGNLGIGITPTVRLQVSGDTILRGSGATSATTALTVQNSSSTNLFRIRNNGDVNFGSDAMYWDAVNSRLGIGVTSPTSKLYIQDASNATVLTLVSLRNNFNSVGTGVAIDFIPESTNFALSRIIATRQNLVNGYTSLDFQTYDGTATTTALYIAGTANRNIGILNSNPTARLDIPASVTTSASLRIRSGTAPTTPNDGDIWFDGTDIKMRIGGVTKTFTLV